MSEDGFEWDLSNFFVVGLPRVPFAYLGYLLADQEGAESFDAQKGSNRGAETVFILVVRVNQTVRVRPIKVNQDSCQMGVAGEGYCSLAICGLLCIFYFVKERIHITLDRKGAATNFVEWYVQMI